MTDKSLTPHQMAERFTYLSLCFHRTNRDQGNSPCESHRYEDCPDEACRDNRMFAAAITALGWSADEFLRQVGEIVKMPIDKPDTIVSALRDVRADFDTFAEWAQPYLDSGLWGGHSILDAIKTELLARDEEVKRLRAALAQIANWPQAEMYTSLASAVSMKAIAKDALAVGEEVTHG
jgi:hypothetical protein